jgi:hypothetical protein
MYVIVFKRDKVDNPLTGSARYRVINCYKDALITTRQVRSIRGLGASIAISTPRRVGTMLNPKSALFGRAS